VAGRPLRPLSARWPDARGRFSLVLPAAARGKRVSLWQAALDAQFAAATAGGAVDMRGWPALSAAAPRDLAFVNVPRTG
jgi:hypothetical protein